MNVPEQIEFVYPRWFASVALWLWLPLLALLILVTIASAPFGFYAAHNMMPDPYAYAQAALVTCVGVWMGGSFLHWVRDRHAFHTRYLLSENGILIQCGETEEHLCLWSDIAKCGDSRLRRYIRLWSPRLSQPVVLMFGTSGLPQVSPTEKFAMTRQFIREKIGSKCEKIWW